MAYQCIWIVLTNQNKESTIYIPPIHYGCSHLLALIKSMKTVPDQAIDYPNKIYGKRKMTAKESNINSRRKEQQIKM